MSQQEKALIFATSENLTRTMAERSKAIGLPALPSVAQPASTESSLFLGSFKTAPLTAGILGANAQNHSSSSSAPSREKFPKGQRRAPKVPTMEEIAKTVAQGHLPEDLVEEFFNPPTVGDVSDTTIVAPQHDTKTHLHHMLASVCAAQFNKIASLASDEYFRVFNDCNRAYPGRDPAEAAQTPGTMTRKSRPSVFAPVSHMHALMQSAEAMGLPPCTFGNYCPCINMPVLPRQKPVGRLPGFMSVETLRRWREGSLPNEAIPPSPCILGCIAIFALHAQTHTQNNGLELWNPIQIPINVPDGIYEDYFVKNDFITHPALMWSHNLMVYYCDDKGVPGWRFRSEILYTRVDFAATTTTKTIATLPSCYKILQAMSWEVSQLLRNEVYRIAMDAPQVPPGTIDVRAIASPQSTLAPFLFDSFVRAIAHATAEGGVPFRKALAEHGQILAPMYDMVFGDEAYTLVHNIKFVPGVVWSLLALRMGFEDAASKVLPELKHNEQMQTYVQGHAQLGLYFRRAFEKLRSDALAMHNDDDNIATLIANVLIEAQSDATLAMMALECLQNDLKDPAPTTRAHAEHLLPIVTESVQRLKATPDIDAWLAMGEEHNSEGFFNDAVKAWLYALHIYPQDGQVRCSVDMLRYAEEYVRTIPVEATPPHVYVCDSMRFGDDADTDAPTINIDGAEPIDLASVGFPELDARYVFTPNLSALVRYFETLSLTNPALLASLGPRCNGFPYYFPGRYMLPGIRALRTTCNPIQREMVDLFWNTFARKCESSGWFVYDGADALAPVPDPTSNIGRTRDTRSMYLFALVFQCHVTQLLLNKWLERAIRTSRGLNLVVHNTITQLDTHLPGVRRCVAPTNVKRKSSTPQIPAPVVELNHQMLAEDAAMIANLHDIKKTDAVQTIMSTRAVVTERIMNEIVNMMRRVSNHRAPNAYKYKSEGGASQKTTNKRSKQNRDDVIIESDDEEDEEDVGVGRRARSSDDIDTDDLVDPDAAPDANGDAPDANGATEFIFKRFNSGRKRSIIGTRMTSFPARYPTADELSKLTDVQLDAHVLQLITHRKNEPAQGGLTGCKPENALLQEFYPLLLAEIKRRRAGFIHDMNEFSDKYNRWAFLMTSAADKIDAFVHGYSDVMQEMAKPFADYYDAEKRYGNMEHPQHEHVFQMRRFLFSKLYAARVIEYAVYGERPAQVQSATQMHTALSSVASSLRASAAASVANSTSTSTSVSMGGSGTHTPVIGADPLFVTREKRLDLVCRLDDEYFVMPPPERPDYMPGSVVDKVRFVDTLRTEDVWISGETSAPLLLPLLQTFGILPPTALTINAPAKGSTEHTIANAHPGTCHIREFLLQMPETLKNPRTVAMMANSVLYSLLGLYKHAYVAPGFGCALELYDTLANPATQKGWLLANKDAVQWMVREYLFSQIHHIPSFDIAMRQQWPNMPYKLFCTSRNEIMRTCLWLCNSVHSFSTACSAPEKNAAALQTQKITPIVLRDRILSFFEWIFVLMESLWQKHFVFGYKFITEEQTMRKRLFGDKAPPLDYPWIEHVPKALQQHIHDCVMALLPGAPISVEWLQCIGLSNFGALAMFAVYRASLPHADGHARAPTGIVRTALQNMTPGDVLVLGFALRGLIQHYKCITFPLSYEMYQDQLNAIQLRSNIDPKSGRSVLDIPVFCTIEMCHAWGCNRTSNTRPWGSKSVGYPKKDCDPITGIATCALRDANFMRAGLKRTEKSARIPLVAKQYNAVIDKLAASNGKYTEADVAALVNAQHQLERSIKKAVRKMVPYRLTRECTAFELRKIHMVGVLLARAAQMYCPSCGCLTVFNIDRYGVGGFSCRQCMPEQRVASSFVMCIVCGTPHYTMPTKLECEEGTAGFHRGRMLAVPRHREAKRDAQGDSSASSDTKHVRIAGEAKTHDGKEPEVQLSSKEWIARMTQQTLTGAAAFLAEAVKGAAQDDDSDDDDTSDDDIHESDDDSDDDARTNKRAKRLTPKIFGDTTPAGLPNPPLKSALKKPVPKMQPAPARAKSRLYEPEKEDAVNNNADPSRPMSLSDVQAKFDDANITNVNRSQSTLVVDDLQKRTVVLYDDIHHHSWCRFLICSRCTGATAKAFEWIASVDGVHTVTEARRQITDPNFRERLRTLLMFDDTPSFMRNRDQPESTPALVRSDSTPSLELQVAAPASTPPLPLSPPERTRSPN